MRDCFILAAGRFCDRRDRGASADEGACHRRRPGRALFLDPDEEGVAGDAHHRVRAQPAPTTPSASASCSPTRRCDAFEAADPDSYRAITENFSYWDDIAIHFKGSVHRIGGNGFCGCSRATLLRLLHERALSLGVEIKFEHDVSDIGALTRDADLVVAADGINSRVREKFAAQFKPSVDLRPNKFAWMGSTRPFDAFTFFFRETEFGIFIAHCYQYEPGRSTWVMETDPQTFERAGFEQARRSGIGEISRECFRARTRRPSPDHQPVDLAQFPDDPLRALDDGQCRAARRCQGDRAFLDRLRHEARDGRRDLAL